MMKRTLHINKTILLILVISLIFCAKTFSQGSLLLVGGGTEDYGDWSDKPYKWFVEQAANRKILVLHYDNTTAWFSGYFPSLSGCTVSNLAIKTIEQANDSSTYKFILEHDGVFLRGGDQLQYSVKWKNTLTQKAIKQIFERGGVIGGTSAGEMVLGEVAYLSGNTDSGALLRTPYSSITLEDNFLGLGKKILAESHTNERGRIGRLPVFIARYKQEKNKEISGIAVDINTSLAVDKTGLAEVMGANAVGILRWQGSTDFKIESGKSFLMRDLKYDQLLPGYKYNFNEDKIIIPDQAQKFIPVKEKYPVNNVILDGSGNSSDWLAGSGSINKLISLLKNQNDTIAIITSVANISHANNLAGSIGKNYRVIPVNEKNKNEISLKNSMSNCNAFIFMGNSLDTLGLLYEPNNAFGGSLQSKINEKAPFLFLGDDVMLAGEYVISNLYSSKYAAYYGNLKKNKALNLINGFHFVPRLYQNPDNSRSYDYTENRIMGLFGIMNQAQLSEGMLIDAGTYVVFKYDGYSVEGLTNSSTPILVIDASASTHSDISTFKRPGKTTPVQYAGLINARINILRPGEIQIITDVKDEYHSSEAKKNKIIKNYPNPFNPETIIEFELSEPAEVSVNIYNAIAQKIKSYQTENYSEGIYRIFWNAGGLPNGNYFISLIIKQGNKIITETLKTTLIK